MSLLELFCSFTSFLVVGLLVGKKLANELKLLLLVDYVVCFWEGVFQKEVTFTVYCFGFGSSLFGMLWCWVIGVLKKDCWLKAVGTPYFISLVYLEVIKVDFGVSVLSLLFLSFFWSYKSFSIGISPSRSITFLFSCSIYFYLTLSYYLRLRASFWIKIILHLEVSKLKYTNYW